MSDGGEKLKILVDEDWKAQVQAEKEATRHAVDAPTGSAGASGSPSARPVDGAQSKSAADHLDSPLPPATLAFLCTTLATQTMIALGQVPNPITGKIDVRLKQAKHYIDMLGMLDEKTAGNRTADESALLDDLLHQLRMAYVSM